MPVSDMTLIAAIATAVLAIAALIAILRRPKHEDTPLRAEIQTLQSTLTARDTDLRETRTQADRATAQAEERHSEITRLTTALATLRSALETELEGERATRQDLSNQISRLETQMKADRASAQEKIDMLAKLRADMETKFRELAQEALKLQGEAFSKTNLERLEATLTPLKEHVGHFEKELKTVHQETVKDRERLRAEIEQLGKRSQEISNEATALTRALKGDQQKQGAWGEMILESILKRSGLREGEEYETQAHREGREGERLRPDVVVKIPGGKTLIIDSKVSLVAYSDAVNAETPAAAEAAAKRHVASLRGHIKGLAAKDYHSAEDNTVDYVILFIPIEGALSEALRQDGQLTEYALDRHITIATPTTLMMALRTVAHVWAVEQRNQNAELIAKRAGLLYDKLAGFVGNMEMVGKRLDQAQDAYQDAFGQLSRGRGNLLSQVETLKSLGARTTRSLTTDFDEAPSLPAPINPHQP